MEEPSSYELGVYRTGFTPQLAAIPSAPDQTRVDRSALPSSRDGDGKSLLKEYYGFSLLNGRTSDYFTVYWKERDIDEFNLYSRAVWQGLYS